MNTKGGFARIERLRIYGEKDVDRRAGLGTLLGEHH